jgi:ribosomal RNA-processing protein 7
MPKVKSTSDSKNNSKKEAGPLEDFFGFKVLPVIVKDGTRHFMYMAQHEVRSESDSLPADRTLFLVNLPVDTTDAHLQYLFRSHGAISSIVYHGAIGGSIQQQQQPSSDDTTAFNNSNLGSSYTSTLIKPKEDKKLKYSKKRKQQDASDNQQDSIDLDNEHTQLRRILHSGASAHVVFSRNDTLDSILAMTRIVRKWGVDEEYTSKTLQPLGFQRK